MIRRQIAVSGSTLVRSLPRIKGLGMLLSSFGDLFKEDDIVVEQTVFGSRMRLRTNDLIGRYMMFTPNYFDRRERRIISRLVRQGDYVVDVGANIGVYTLLMARLVGPSGRVDSVEAEAFNAGELRHNVSLNALKQVRIHQVGVSDKDETLSLMLNTTGNAGAHSFYDQSHIAEPETQKIQCVPLSAIVNGRTPKFIKMDIEGFEHRVLQKYFQDCSRESLPNFMMIEDNPARREADAVHLCLNHGYEVMDRVEANVFLRLVRRAAERHI